ncbi:MAG: metal-dependent hydrolase [Ketobacteraceae bacterium]|nr:metal-dependent hydrolase [Ketobacteraceae bacterium]
MDTCIRAQRSHLKYRSMTLPISPLTPSELEITPRNLSISFPETIPRHWLGGNPVATHWFNALSTVLPVGEDFFIYALREARKDIEDAELRQMIKSFIAQEAFHSREHKKYNQWLKTWGYDIDGMERNNDRVTSVRRKMSRDQLLAVTLAFEHLTSILSAATLRHNLMAEADPNMKMLWNWHSVEEIEHKSVAWEVYSALGASYRLRVGCMSLAIVALLGIRVNLRLAYFLFKDGLLFRPKIWLQGLRFAFGKKGIFRLIKDELFAFYRRDFHPWQQNTLFLTIKEIAEIEKYNAA